MGRVFGAVDCWVRFSKRFRLVQPRPFSTTTTKNNSNDNINAAVRDYDAYRQLDKLDFMTAAKILFTTPPKKKFGIDFHLVQLFFACMPSLAVYLVAQYARYEIRRMEAELELKKKKAEEEEKAKVMESNAIEDKEAESDPELLKVKVRLDKLEEVVKEIAVETKKQSGGSITKNQEDGDDKEHNAATEPSNTQSRSEASKSTANDNLSKQKSRERTPGMSQEGMSGLAPVTDASQEDQK